MDDAGVVVSLFEEGDSEVLDAVGYAEFHQILDEIGEVYEEEIIVLVGVRILTPKFWNQVFLEKALRIPTNKMENKHNFSRSRY